MSTRIRNVDLNLLKVFDAVMTELNITRAAARLCVSQPAIRNALARLRALHEDELFVRGAKGVTPTAKAKEIAGQIREALQLIEGTFQADDGFRPEASQRRFNVALTDLGELYFLPHIMHELATRAPGVDLVCLPDPGATLKQELRSGMVDLVWDWARIDDPDYYTELIFEDQSFCVARRGHPRITNSVTLDLFLELEHVALRPTRTHVPMIERKLETLGLERRVATAVSHVLVMPSIVARSDLIACIPGRLARLYARQLDLQMRVFFSKTHELRSLFSDCARFTGGPITHICKARDRTFRAALCCAPGRGPRRLRGRSSWRSNVASHRYCNINRVFSRDAVADIGN
jgi:DNA-binding transcriptional LysR family regulator